MTFIDTLLLQDVNLPGISDLTAVSRIIRFSCPRQKRICHEAGPQRDQRCFVGWFSLSGKIWDRFYVEDSRKFYQQSNAKRKGTKAVGQATAPIEWLTVGWQSGDCQGGEEAVGTS
jgi:hypothetical protein